MSHFTTVEVALKDLANVAESLKEMGFEVQEGKHTITDWAHQTHEVDLSIKKDGKQLTLGWAHTADGALTMVHDFWGTGLNQKNFMTELNSLYSKNTATKWLQGKGYSVSYDHDEEGNLLVVGSRW